MELNKEFTQIYIRPKDNMYCLDGKVVDKILLTQDKNSYDENELIITFKDKTFVAFEIDDVSEDYEAERRPIISSSAIISPKCYNSGHFRTRVVDGKVVFEPLVQNRVDAGLWNVTVEEVEQLIKEDERKHEEYDYKRYLVLKEKFEGREEEFKDVRL